MLKRGKAARRCTRISLSSGLLLHGLSMAEIAGRLHVSEYTPPAVAINQPAQGRDPRPSRRCPGELVERGTGRMLQCSGGISERERYDVGVAGGACTAGAGRGCQPSRRSAAARRDPAPERGAHHVHADELSPSLDRLGCDLADVRDELQLQVARLSSAVAGTHVELDQPPLHVEGAVLICRYIARCNRHVQEPELRRVVNTANVARCSTSRRGGASGWTIAGGPAICASWWPPPRCIWASEAVET
jgi:hypothetical protein